MSKKSLKSLAVTFVNVIYNGLDVPIAGFLTIYEAVDYADNRIDDKHYVYLGSIDLILSYDKNISFKEQYKNYKDTL